MGWKKKQPRGYDRYDKWVPSVTELLSIDDKSHFLVPWAAKCTADYIKKNWHRVDDDNGMDVLLKHAKASRFAVTKQALQDGTDAHELCERHGNGDYPRPAEYKDMRTEVLYAYNRYLDYLDHEPMTIVANEQVLFSDMFGYAGTCDRICVDAEGRGCVIDWKSGKVLDELMGVQAVAYAMAANETWEGGIQIQRAIVVRIGKDGKDFNPKKDILEVPHENWTDYFGAFLGYKAAWQWRQKHG